MQGARFVAPHGVIRVGRLEGGGISSPLVPLAKWVLLATHNGSFNTAISLRHGLRVWARCAIRWSLI